VREGGGRRGERGEKEGRGGKEGQRKGGGTVKVSDPCSINRGLLLGS
jgi:hypothetical protein